MKRRLFIGNLAPTVEQGELREKFTSLMSGHQDATVGNVEVRCKNGDNYFGFVDIHVENDESPAGPPPFLRKCIDLMNNTKWKGSLIKVQLAKESFLDQLKRERENKAEVTALAGPVGKKVAENPEIQSQKKILADLNRYTRPKRVAEDIDKLPRESDNFDFEIVSNKSVKKVKTDKTDGSKSSDEESEEESSDGIPKFRGLRFAYPQGPPQSEVNEVGRGPAVPPPRPPTPIKPNPPVIQLDEHQQRLQRIAGYTVPSTVAESKAPSSSPRQPRHSKFPENVIADEAPTPPVKGVVFKKNRQQNSDILRQQSLDNRGYGIKNQQLGMIKSSLANINNNMNFHETTGEARPKMDSLFGEDGDNQEDYENDFRLKKQFEGAAGQKLLELRGQWGFDERFKIDDRFNNREETEEEQNGLSTHDEKNKQLGILSDLLGTSVQFQPKHKDTSKSKAEHNPVIQTRYDPDFHNQEDEEQMDADDGLGQKQKKKQTDKLKNKEKEVPEELIRSTEPATYKTASNLKSLFSAEDSKEQAQGSFSLLATFGQEADAEGKMDQDTSPAGTTNLPGAPRQFWQSNPFKYDSSDDEDDESSNVKGKAKTEQKPAQVILKPLSEFFFKKNDKRLKGLEDFFLKADKTEERVDYDEKRRELKTIVKAKARNAKRKDDKRTLAIKRSIRKRRKYKKTAISSSSSNAERVRPS